MVQLVVIPFMIQKEYLVWIELVGMRISSLLGQFQHAKEKREWRTHEVIFVKSLSTKTQVASAMYCNPAYNF